jgi:hypothetical protein
MRLAATLLALSCALPLHAQGARSRAVPMPENRLMALARMDLRFRSVLPGIPQSISPRQGDRAALFEIQGPSGAAVRVELLLPEALVTGDEPFARLPISFGAADGFYARTENLEIGQAFHPLLPLITTLGDGGRLFVRLGGTVRPGLPQAGGAYRAEITLIVYDIGS